MKRVKLKLKKPNALFELWLEEWMKEAATRNSELQHHFSRALGSLRKYPLPLESGKDCIILQHFGTKLCSMLDRKLEEHRNNAGSLSLTEEYICKCTSREKYVTYRGKSNTQKPFTNSVEVTKAGIATVFEGIGIASWSTETYIALFTLYIMSEDTLYQGYVLETDVLSRMHEIYGTKSKTPILNLLSDGLVSMTGSPVRYSLTDQGITIAKSICNITETDVKLLTNLNKVREIQTQLHVIYSKKSEALISSEHDNIEAVKSISSKSKSPRKLSSPKDMVIESQNINKETAARKGKKASNAKGTAKTKVVNPESDVLEDIQVDINLEPHKFDIVLLVDTQETCGGKTKPQDDATISELSELGVLFEVRHLKVGDFAWIARCRHTGKELVLPYIVERKRIDDLSASIVDGRFHEQKFRLKQSGIQNIMYVVECYDKTQRLTIPHSALMQASVNSVVQDDFTVKYTKSHKDTMFHLSCVTKILIREYKAKNLISCKKEKLNESSISDSSIRLMVFDEFNKAASKQKVFKVREMFVRQLLQLKGLSVDKALAIVEKYPTPRILIEAFNQSSGNGEQMLSNIKASDKKRAINASVSKAVFQLYTKRSLS